VPKQDPLGYYRILNVSPEASGAEIRLAYRLLKKSYHEERKQLAVSKIRAAFKTLSNPVTRRTYDNPDGGGRARNPAAGLRGQRHGAKTIHIGLALLAVSSIVLLIMISPSLKTHFVSFEAGDELVWSETGEQLGSVVTFEAKHRFFGGSVAAAYQIDPTSGEAPVWYPARDLERYCHNR
jgi:curved DNA-binding protein CbpA